MKKRAMLIGSQTGVLSGVHRDVNAVADKLSIWGFTSELCLDGDATRQGILDRYRQLISDAKAEDAIIVYYSGHGGLAANSDYKPMIAEGVIVPRHHQFIVPVDIDESTDTDFRGITSIELSALLTQLTEKTKNATVILDCCHSARMSRDFDLIPKALPRTWFVGIASHLKQLSDQGITTNGFDVESNPFAVRLVAAGPHESAYEYTNDNGERIGLLTESFLIALDEAEGQKVSWRSFGTRVRERVLSVISYQRPEIEGPSDRVLFELERVDFTGVLPVIFRNDVPVLQGGRLLGVNVGDEYQIVPIGVEKPEPENVIAQVIVENVAGDVSEIGVLKGEPNVIPEGANAFPLSVVLPKHAVSVSAQGEEDKQMRTAIDDSKRLRVAMDDEQDGLLAQVVVADDKIDLRDRSGSYSLIDRKPFSEESIQATVQNLNKFARVQALLNLSSGEGENALDNPFEIEFGRVVDGNALAISKSDDVLSVGDRIYIKMSNASPDKLYFTVFDIGLSGKITLLTRSEPSGIEVLPNQEYVLGYREGTGLRGLGLGWAEGVPEDGPREEAFVVIVSDVAQDLRTLEGTGMRAFGEVPSPLEQLVDQIGLGGTRDITDEKEKDEVIDVRYSVERIEFLLSPTPTPTREEDAFLIDERPKQSTLFLAPKGLEDPPSQVAIRLKELIVHSNRALGSAEIRIDNMIVTGLTEEDSNSFYTVKTARFPKIKDGDRLPLDNMLVYHGPVTHFVDMAVWVSRDQKDSLALADMIKAEMNSNDFKLSATAIAALAVAAPQAALVVGAISGAATLIQIGTRLLLQAVGKSIGLYRTSHLAFEQFGVGRHPAQGVMTAQDFSFSYEILPLD